MRPAPPHRSNVRHTASNAIRQLRDIMGLSSCADGGYAGIRFAVADFDGQGMRRAAHPNAADEMAVRRKKHRHSPLQRPFGVKSAKPQIVAFQLALQPFELPGKALFQPGRGRVQPSPDLPSRRALAPAAGGGSGPPFAPAAYPAHGTPRSGTFRLPENAAVHQSVPAFVPARNPTGGARVPNRSSSRARPRSGESHARALPSVSSR